MLTPGHFTVEVPFKHKILGYSWTLKLCLLCNKSIRFVYLSVRVHKIYNKMCLCYPKSAMQHVNCTVRCREVVSAEHAFGLWTNDHTEQHIWIQTIFKRYKKAFCAFSSMYLQSMNSVVYVSHPAWHLLSFENFCWILWWEDMLLNSSINYSKGTLRSH